MPIRYISLSSERLFMEADIGDFFLLIIAVGTLGLCSKSENINWYHTQRPHAVLRPPREQPLRNSLNIHDSEKCSE
jgi:hypothetical protein